MIGINDDISQGSPVSPIMFLIFIQHVLEVLKQTNEIVTLNYADDFAMVTESSCARINSIRLQLALLRFVFEPLSSTLDVLECKRMMNQNDAYYSILMSGWASLIWLVPLYLNSLF